MKDEQRYDVVIYKIKTREVTTIAGEDMPMSEGSFHTAEKRLDTVSPRLNDDYGAEIVETGKYKVGDILED